MNERVALAVDHHVDVLGTLGRDHRHDRGNIDPPELRTVRHPPLHRTGRVDHDERAVECGHVRNRVIERAAERALPVVRRSMLVRSPHLVREHPRLGDLGGVGDRLDHRLDRRLADAGLVEVAEVAQQRHRAHRRDHRLPRLRVHAARQPARQSLPRDACNRERGRAALPEQCASFVDRRRVERRRCCQHRQHRRIGDRVVVMPAVQEVLEQRRLRRVARRRVHELDHVRHANLTRDAVVAERGPLGVEPTHRVGHPALDRHRHVAAVRGQPVTDHLRGLVGPLQGARDHRPTTGTTRGDVLRGHDDRGRTHQQRLTEVLHQADRARRDVAAGEERRVRRRHLVDEVDEPGITLGGVLVERVLADHVRRGEEEELGRGIALVPHAALVGERAPPARADRRGRVDAARLPLGAGELGHVVAPRGVVGFRRERPVREPRWTSGADSNGRPEGPSRQRKYARPSQLTGHRIGLGTRGGGGRSSVLCR